MSPKTSKKSLHRTVRKSTDTYCALHNLEFPVEAGCPKCAGLPIPRQHDDAVPEPDEVNTPAAEYTFDATGLDWITCPCGAVRVLPITDDCILCGRDTYTTRH